MLIEANRTQGNFLKGDSMKRLVITIVVLFGSPVWALTYMGPPASNVEQGELLLGFDYSNREIDAEFSGNGLRGGLRHVDSDLYLGKAGLALFDGFEIFGRFGVNEIEDLGNESAWGAGTKVTFGEKGNVSWGALFQFMSFTAEGPGYIGNYSLVGDYEVDEYQLAIGPTFDHGGSSVYFGPFIHFLDGEADINNFGSVDIEQKSEFGVYIGVLWEIAGSSNLSIEFQGTDDAEMIAISLLHRFGGPSEPSE
jgi:hypothetical protein